MKADGDFPIGGHVHQLNIAAIGLHGRADQINDPLDALAQAQARRRSGS
jgi:hypothetical protein